MPRRQRRAFWQIPCRLGTAAGLAPVFTSLFACLPTHADWGTYQGDAAHTGYIPGRYCRTQPSLDWSANLGPTTSDGVAGIAVGSGMVFLVPGSIMSTPQPCLYALDQDTGALRWSKSFTPGPIIYNSAPAYANGVVYFQTDGNVNNNYLHAYDATTGSSLFNAPYGAQWERYQSPVIYQGSLYMGGGAYGGMYSFNALSGQQNWWTNLPQYSGWTPAVDDKYCYVFIRNQLHMNDRLTGAPVATVTVGDNVMTATVTLGTHNKVFSVDNGGQFICFDTTLDTVHTPHIAWKLSGSYTSQPSLAEGILFTSKGGQLLALSEADGHTLWSWTPTTGAISGPMIVTDNLLFAHTASTTYAIDLDTHMPLWSVPASGIMALSDNTLYIANKNAVVYAYAVPVPEPASGLLLAVGALALLRRGSRVPALA